MLTKHGKIRRICRGQYDYLKYSELLRQELSTDFDLVGGTLRLVPEGHVQDVLKADYQAMRIMIYGEYPEFESILSSLQGLEDEINRLS